MRDISVAGILAGACVLALWGAWRSRFRVASYLVAGTVVVVLVAVLVATGQADMIAVSAFLLALVVPTVVFNQRQAARRHLQRT